MRKGERLLYHIYRLYTSKTIRELALFLVVLQKVQGLRGFSCCPQPHAEIYCLENPEAIIALVLVSHSQIVSGIDEYVELCQKLC